PLLQRLVAPPAVAAALFVRDPAVGAEAGHGPAAPVEAVAGVGDAWVGLGVDEHPLPTEAAATGANGVRSGWAQAHLSPPCRRRRAGLAARRPSRGGSCSRSWTATWRRAPRLRSLRG